MKSFNNEILLDKKNLLIIGNPHSNEAVKSFLFKLIQIIKISANKIFVIAGDKIQEDNEKIVNYLVNYEISPILSKRIKNFLKIQIKIIKLILLQKDYNIVIFLPQLMILPALILKLKRKKLILYMGGRASKSSRNPIEKLILYTIEITSLFLANKIIVESYSGIEFLNLKLYKRKILICSQGVDTNKFKIINPINERNNIIGFIGRLSKEKGIEKFVQSLFLLEKNNEFDLNVLIIGNGNQREEISNLIENHITISDKIKILNWIPNSNLPDYYNKIKLFILPSYSEGLPNTILEAMACGTPVLATPVGAIPDVIRDGETGFIMENNSPECIAENVIRALNHPDLEGIAERARKYVEKEFTLEKAVERWRHILDAV